MTKKVRNRILGLVTIIILASLGIYLILYNLKNNISFFYPPSKIIEYRGNMRIGGLVKKDSIEKITNSKIKFIITDDIKDLEIIYEGILPALFRENQGVVAKGQFVNDRFIASELLTKHDETYKPPMQ